METLFVKVLKKLISEQLTPLSTSQQSKSQSYGYNKVLSLQQQTIIDKLLTDVIRYVSDANDEMAIRELAELINTAREKIQGARTFHGEPVDEGEAMTCLTLLTPHAETLYKKIKDRKTTTPDLYAYTVLDTIAKNNPLHLVYELEIYYLGNEIFNPNKKIDMQTRLEKEKKLAERIKILSEQIKVEHKLKDQSDRALKILCDLKRDNEDIVSNEPSMFSTVLSKFSFYGANLNVQTTGEGRLGRFISSTILLVTGMSEKEFEPLSEPLAEPLIKPAVTKITKQQASSSYHNEEDDDDIDEKSQESVLSTSI